MNNTTPVQQAARLVGIVFLLVGIAGFIPGITTELYDGLDFAGDGSEAELLGLFQVSVLHNIVHALFGVGIFMAATPQGARTYLLGAGAIYIVLFLPGDHRRRRLGADQRRRQLAPPRPRGRPARARLPADARPGPNGRDYLAALSYRFGRWAERSALRRLYAT